MNRLYKLGLFLVIIITIVGCAPQATPAPTAVPTAKPYRVALVVPGPINDMAWNQTGYEALMNLKQQLGVEVAFKEGVLTKDGEEVLRTFASQGFDLIIGHGDEYSEGSKVVAPEFPKVQFAVVNGQYTADNLASISFFDEQMTFLAGATAAKMSKSGKIGYVGGLEIPPLVRFGKGYEQGAKYVNPNIQVLTTLTGSFEDAAKAKEAALAMIEQGADVIFYWLDSGKDGVLEAAKEKKVFLIGSMFDQHELAPELILTNTVQDYKTAMLLATKAAMAGTLKGNTLYDLAAAAEGLTGFYNVPEDVQNYIKQVKQDIISGKIVVNH